MDTQNKPPIFDLSALGAVHTLLEPQEGLCDPWGVELAGSFANLFIFSEQVRVILPSADDSSTIESIRQPSLIHDFSAFSPDFIIAEPYSTIDHLDMMPESMNQAAKSFDRFARQNKVRLTKFCALHQTSYVQQHQRLRVKQGTTFNVSMRQTDPLFLALERYTRIEIASLLYAFDLSLRLPLYGNLAGPNAFYLNHPVRDSFDIVVKSETSAPAPPIPISFAEPMRHIIMRLSREEYVNTVKILHDKVRELGILGMPAGQITRESIREIAAAARFRPRLRAEYAVWDIVKLVMSGALGVACVPVVGPTGAPIVTGVAITVSELAWKNEGKGPLLPQGIGNICWLRWAVKWDIEDQAKEP